ncbi:hypothetical protein [Marinoscillum sp. MHG1-6]|uniref:hypothetical protein n=1 Tax=Marinoscillum sp. MHG1-6 TaxID=2959627 RepID=UPI0021583288|nr:hypothetical protein [Marinoscillum sp. MHG1-6]
MKNRYIGYLAFLIFAFSSFYLGSRIHLTYASHHSSLSDDNMETDMYLQNARYYIHDNVFDRSTYHIDQAKKSLRRLEEDIDIESGQEIEDAINSLNKIEREIVENKFEPSDMNKAFAKTLETVALAELRISERYAESANLDIAQVALKYAKLHLRNAMEYEHLPNKTYDLKVYQQIDSLIESPEISPIEISNKLDEMIREMNEIIALNDN